MRAPSVGLRVVARLFVVLVASGCGASSRETPARAPHPSAALGDEPSTAQPTTPSASSPLETKIEAPSPSASASAIAPEGPSKTVCVGKARPARPAAATCCYPAMEPIRAAMRALRPRFVECLTRHGDPEGRVLLRIAVGTSGEPDEVCGESTIVDPSGAFLRCVVEAARAARLPASSDAQERVCGSMRLAYPVQFSRSISSP